MGDRVFHQRLQNELRHPCFQQLLIFQLQLHGDLVSKTAPLDGEIVLRVIQLVGEGHIFLHIGNGIAEKRGQRLRGLGDVFAVRQQRVRPDGLQCVIEKMGIDLVLQRQIFRLLLPQLGDLLTVQAFFHVREKELQQGVFAPVRLQDGVQVPVILITPERLVQLPSGPQPHSITYLYSFL